MPSAFLHKKSLLDQFKDDYAMVNPIKARRTERQWDNPIVRHKREKGVQGWAKSFAGKKHYKKLMRFNAMRNEGMKELPTEVAKTVWGADFATRPRDFMINVDDKGYAVDVWPTRGDQYLNPSWRILAAPRVIVTYETGLQGNARVVAEQPYKDVEDIKSFFLKAFEEGVDVKSEAFNAKEFYELFDKLLDRLLDIYDESTVSVIVDSYPVTDMWDKGMTVDEIVDDIKGWYKAQMGEAHTEKTAWAYLEELEKLEGEESRMDAAEKILKALGCKPGTEGRWYGKDGDEIDTIDVLDNTEWAFAQKVCGQLQEARQAKKIYPKFMQISTQRDFDRYIKPALGKGAGAYGLSDIEGMWWEIADGERVPASAKTVREIRDSVSKRPRFIFISGTGFERGITDMSLTEYAREMGMTAKEYLDGYDAGSWESKKSEGNYRVKIGWKNAYDQDCDLDLIVSAPDEDTAGERGIAYVDDHIPHPRSRRVVSVRPYVEEGKKSESWDSYAFPDGIHLRSYSGIGADEVRAEVWQDGKRVDKATYVYGFDGDKAAWVKEAFQRLKDKHPGLTVYDSGDLSYSRFADKWYYEFYEKDGTCLNPVFAAACDKHFDYTPEIIDKLAEGSKGVVYPKKSEAMDETLSYEKGNKNSRGEDAPWVIRDHKGGKVLASFAKKADAEAHLERMQHYSKSESAGYVLAYVGPHDTLYCKNKYGEWTTHIEDAWIGDSRESFGDEMKRNFANFIKHDLGELDVLRVYDNDESKRTKTIRHESLKKNFRFKDPKSDDDLIAISDIIYEINRRNESQAVAEKIGSELESLMERASRDPKWNEMSDEECASAMYKAAQPILSKITSEQLEEIFRNPGHDHEYFCDAIEYDEEAEGPEYRADDLYDFSSIRHESLKKALHESRVKKLERMGSPKREKMGEIVFEPVVNFKPQQYAVYEIDNDGNELECIFSGTPGGAKKKLDDAIGADPNKKFHVVAIAYTPRGQLADSEVVWSDDSGKSRKVEAAKPWEVSWWKYSRGEGEDRVDTFSAAGDVAALREIVRRGIAVGPVSSEPMRVVPDEAERKELDKKGWDETDSFNSVEEVLDEIRNSNGAGCDAIYYIKRPDGSYLLDERETYDYETVTGKPLPRGNSEAKKLERMGSVPFARLGADPTDTTKEWDDLMGELWKFERDLNKRDFSTDSDGIEGWLKVYADEKSPKPFCTIRYSKAKADAAAPWKLIKGNKTVGFFKTVPQLAKAFRETFGTKGQASRHDDTEREELIRDILSRKGNEFSEEELRTWNIGNLIMYRGDLLPGGPLYVGEAIESITSRDVQDLARRALDASGAEGFVLDIVHTLRNGINSFITAKGADDGKDTGIMWIVHVPEGDEEFEVEQYAIGPDGRWPSKPENTYLIQDAEELEGFLADEFEALQETLDIGKEN